MPTRNVVVTERQARLIDELVSSGRFQNASEVLRVGLRLVEEYEAAQKAKLKALREAARVGIADMEAGRYKTFKTSKSLRRHLKSVAEQAIKRGRQKMVAE